jgi:hypothetical protein
LLGIGGYDQPAIELIGQFGKPINAAVNRQRGHSPIPPKLPNDIQSAGTDAT